MKTTETFMKDAKKYIIFAFLTPLEEDRLYTNPIFIPTSANTLCYHSSTNLQYNDATMVFKNLRKSQIYFSIDFSEIQSFKIKPVVRIGGIPYQTHLIELFIKTEMYNFQIETKDIDDVLKLCVYLHHKKIEIKDPCSIIKVLIRYRDQEGGYYQYMLEHYKEIAKKYHLDLPRIRVERTQ